MRLVLTMLLGVSPHEAVPAVRPDDEAIAAVYESAIRPLADQDPADALVELLRSLGANPDHVRVQEVPPLEEQTRQRHRQRLKSKLQEAGLGPIDVEAVVAAEERRLQRPGRNVIARVPGTSGRKIVVGTSLEVPRGGTGAIDPWVGCAVLAHLHAAFRDRAPRHELIFVGFGSTEIGCEGARVYVEGLGEDAVKNVDLMVSLDALGMAGPALLERGSASGAILLSPGRGTSGRSVGPGEEVRGPGRHRERASLPSWGRPPTAGGRPRPGTGDGAADERGDAGGGEPRRRGRHVPLPGLAAVSRRRLPGAVEPTVGDVRAGPHRGGSPVSGHPRTCCWGRPARGGCASRSPTEDRTRRSRFLPGRGSPRRGAATRYRSPGMPSKPGKKTPTRTDPGRRTGCPPAPGENTSDPEGRRPPPPRMMRSLAAPTRAMSETTT